MAKARPRGRPVKKKVDSKAIVLNIPLDMLERIDRAASHDLRNRTNFILNVLINEISNDRYDNDL